MYIVCRNSVTADYTNERTSAKGINSIHETTNPGRKVNNLVVRMEDPEFQPGGTPSSIVGSANRDVEVTMKPPEFVTMNVATVGDGVIPGNAVALNPLGASRIGLYVLVARPDDTIPSGARLADVLNAYGGVLKVGVGTREFGNVVATVAESEDKIEATEPGVSASPVVF